MKILSKFGRDDIAIVYVAELSSGKRVEFVESVQPPIPRDKKWVLIISTLYGCPIQCKFCDAGGWYNQKISTEDLLAQIEFMVISRYPDRKIPVEKFKIQFARMGEPALNDSVLEILQKLPKIYDAPGFLPSLSTIAPAGREKFFDKLLEIKKELYGANFQFQFSLHTTDIAMRDWLIPVKKWSFEQMASYGERWFEAGDRKITLNFALANESPLEVETLLRYFSPEKYLIKMTPLNPTYQSVKNNLTSHITRENMSYLAVESLRKGGYDVLLSVGEYEENNIGSNCGQYLTNYEKAEVKIEGGYTYNQIEPLHL